MPAELVTQAPSAAEAGETAEVDGPALSLLYIEDNNSNIKLMEHLLGHRPAWKMTTAKTGDDRARTGDGRSAGPGAARPALAGRQRHGRAASAAR